MDISRFKELQQEHFRSLLEVRKGILQEFDEKITRLEQERDLQLHQNLLMMKELGISEADLPPPPMSDQEKEAFASGRCRKLTNNQIKRILQDVMEPTKSYPSSALLKALMISYADFKEFVEANEDFICFEGKNKWRTYSLK